MYEYNIMDMSPNDYIKIIKKKDDEIKKLEESLKKTTSNIEIIGKQNRELKKRCERYEKSLSELHKTTKNTR